MEMFSKFKKKKKPNDKEEITNKYIVVLCHFSWSQNLPSSQSAGKCEEREVVIGSVFVLVFVFLMEKSELLPDAISSHFLSH